MAEQAEPRDLSWCIVELMGHQKTGAKVKEETLFSVVMCRCDIPVEVPDGEPEKWITQFVSGAALYRLTPTTEELARAVAYRFTQPPVNRYELLPASAPSPPPVNDESCCDPDNDPDTGYEYDDPPF